MDTTITTRKLTSAEKSKMRKSHLFLIPMALVVSLMVFAAFMIGDEFPPVKYAVIGIGAFAFLFYLSKQIKLELELNSGQVEIVNGAITEKKKTGKSRRRGINDRNFSYSPDHTFMFYIGDKRYLVKPTDYDKYEVGDRIVLEWFPQSKHLLGVTSTV